MIIRKQIESDVDQLELLFQSVRRKTFIIRSSDDFLIGDYQKSTAEDEVWVAEESGIIVGFVSTYPSHNFIHNLFVYPEYQGKGIGTDLLKVAEASLACPMTLKIAMDNLSVCSFYEKHGWVEGSVHEEVDEPYILYIKKIKDC